MKSSSNRTRLISILAISVFVVSAGIGWWEWRTSPSWSLLRIGKAVEQHDVATFERLVDVEGILSRFLAVTTEKTGQRNDEGLLGASLSQIVSTIARNTLVEHGRQLARQWIETGQLAGFPSDVPIVDFITSLNGSSPRVVSKRIVFKEGKVCRVELALQFDSSQEPIDFDLLLRDRGSYWQVAELPGLLESLGRWDSQRRLHEAEIRDAQIKERAIQQRRLEEQREAKQRQIEEERTAEHAATSQAIASVLAIYNKGFNTQDPRLIAEVYWPSGVRPDAATLASDMRSLRDFLDLAGRITNSQIEEIRDARDTADASATVQFEKIGTRTERYQLRQVHGAWKITRLY